jgi:transposase
MAKSPNARYTLEYKLEAVRMVRSGQSLAAVSKILGIAAQTLHNWVKADRESRLGGAESRPVSPEQMEIARLRAELARARMEIDILGKATAYFAKLRG